MRLSSVFLSVALALLLAVPCCTPAQEPCKSGLSSTTDQVAAVHKPNGEAAIESDAEPRRKLGAVPDAPDAQGGTVSGTVTDTNGDIIPGATVQLDGASRTGQQTKTANDNAFFQFNGLKPGVTYHITVSAAGFDDWTSQPITVVAGQYLDMTGIQVRIASAVSSVLVYSSTEQIAVQQVQIAEQQRVLGFIPNFYVIYDSKNAVPLSTRLKFQMALHVSVDPVSIAGAAFLAGINQAADRPDYQQGLKGYGQRFGAAYADGVTDIMFGGAILPSLLHQDPRYFYQGTGTVKSRVVHALSNPFICHGDNGRLQPNFSSLGGDLISSSISNAYYPASNRGANFVFTQFALSTAEREVSSLVQEFIIRKLTPSANRDN
jgi:hypothetical protein